VGIESNSVDFVKYAIFVKAAPFSHQGASTAYLFCKAALQKGHTINRVFFYGDGALNGNAFIAPPQDETNLVTHWQQLTKQYGVELIICVAAALRRGVLDITEAERYEKTAANLATGFTISGLGQLIEASINAERFIIFG